MIDDIGAAPVEYQIDRIRDALVDHPGVQELGLQVTIRGGIVFVSGPVATPARRDAIPAVVRSVLPGLEVRNDVEVVDLAGPVGEHET